MHVGFRCALRNFSYTFASNLVSIIISIATMFLLPKYLSTTEYGAWQVYGFYLGYVGFFHFGWLDGIFLRYGGMYYDQLNKPMLKSQFLLLGLIEAFFALLFIMGFKNYGINGELLHIFLMVGISGIIVLLFTMLQFILQMTNRIAEFASISIISRLLFLVAIVCVIISNTISNVSLMYIDMTIRFLTLIYIMYICSDIMSAKVLPFRFVLPEIKLNICVGIKLMLANIAGISVLGIVRFGILQRWDLATFGKVSLTLGISNFLMLFITSISIVLFPILKRIDNKELPKLYKLLRTTLVTVILFAMAFCYPIRYYLSLWIPRYADGLVYMSLLFPVCLYESKISMLINTYLKSMRQEKMMLKINFLSVIVSAVVTFLTVYLIGSINMAVLSIVFVFAFRCITAELFINKMLKLRLSSDIVLEILMVIIFMFCHWHWSGIFGSILYFTCFVVYCFFQKEKLKQIGLLLKREFQ